MHSATVLGYSLDGEVYCIDCYLFGLTDEEKRSAKPVFAGDEGVDREKCTCCGADLWQ